jgi:hypothetical protein
MSTRSRSRSATVETQIIPPETAPLAIVEDLKAAVLRGELTSKLARELLVRLAPPARVPRMPLELPEVVDAQSYAAASQLVLQATAEGRLTANDGLALLRLAKGTLEAHRTAERTRR